MGCILECRDICKRFGGLQALSHINLQVEAGEILGVIGPNGAGKTTLFNILAGAIPPTEGAVFFKGRDVTALDDGRMCRLGVSRTWQQVRPFHSLTALENVLVGISFGRPDPPGRKAGEAEAMEILAFMGLESKARLPANRLNLAERKHLEIARALGAAPEVLLLDEVVSGLTPTEVGRLIEVIRRIQARHIAIVMIEHVLKVIMELCPRVVVLDFGVQIALGAPREVVRHPDVAKAYIGKFEMDEWNE